MTASQKEQIKVMRQQGVGYVKIGKVLGVSNNTVRSFCSRNGLEGDHIKNTVNCKQCGKPTKIIPKRKPKQFCSDACRMSWWNSHQEYITRKALYDFACACCGKPFTAYGNRGRKYCCHQCYIQDRYGKGRDSHE